MRAWLDDQTGRGRLTFTIEELRSERDASLDAALAALSRAERNHLIVSPSRGFYVIVPAEYRAQGAPPWQWYLDAMMRDLGAAYYVGLLTAAAHHGVSPQAAQEVQIVADRQIRVRRVGRQRLVFIRSSRMALAPVGGVRGPAGDVRISSPEMTLLDLVAYPARAGGWGNIASVVPDLALATSRAGWRAALQVGPPVAQVQRLGHLLDRSGAAHTDILVNWVAARRHDVVSLVPRGDPEGPLDTRWKVIADLSVQAD